MSKAILEIKNIHKRFGKSKVLKGIDFTIKKGEVVCLIGPSGCGKTTLLKIVAGLLKPDSGTVKLDGEIIDRPTRTIGMVFQEYNIWPHKTVLENVTEALMTVERRHGSEAIQIAKKNLEKVDMLDKINFYPRALSGGQKQRTAIARTLAMNPEVILLDEITSALDPELVEGILKTIKNLATDGRTMVIVTHHIEFAREIADRVLFLGDGEIIEEGLPEIIFRKPKNKRTKEFLNSILKEKRVLIS